MADRVAGEGRAPIPLEAVEAAWEAVEGSESRSYLLGIVEAAIDALPSEWLLARALDEVELGAVLEWSRTASEGHHEKCGDDCAAKRGFAKLRAGLSVLEQEAGGGENTDG